MHHHYDLPGVRELPCTYFKRQMAVTFVHEPEGVEPRHEIGIDNVLWSTDFPHPICNWPNAAARGPSSSRACRRKRSTRSRGRTVHACTVLPEHRGGRDAGSCARRPARPRPLVGHRRSDGGDAARRPRRRRHEDRAARAATRSAASRLPRVAPRQAQRRARPEGRRRTRDAFLALVAARRRARRELFARARRSGSASTTRRSRAANPRLVYCSITGYGRDNPHSDRPGYDALVAARTGLHWEQRGRLGGAAPHHDRRAGPTLPDLEIPTDAPAGPAARRARSSRPRAGRASAPPSSRRSAIQRRAARARDAPVAASGSRRRCCRARSPARACVALAARREHRPPGSSTWIFDRARRRGSSSARTAAGSTHWVPNPRFILSARCRRHAERDAADLAATTRSASARRRGDRRARTTTSRWRRGGRRSSPPTSGSEAARSRRICDPAGALARRGARRPAARSPTACVTELERSGARARSAQVGIALRLRTHPAARSRGARAASSASTRPR